MRYVQAKKKAPNIKKNYRMAVKPPKATLPIPKAAKKGSYPPVDMMTKPAIMHNRANIRLPLYKIYI